MVEQTVTSQIAKEHGLLPAEYEQICAILGRTPTWTEIGIYSVMWSEHCSYKNSILELKKLPRSGGRLLVEAGAENAGLVDLGDGLAVAFKIESHNHPSAVEPHQGAATGVGGILRDIFTMGGRPLANLVSLRFGELTDPHNRYLVDGVVRGIGDYGNCMGIPTIAGETTFDPSYRTNPLVNAMTVGVVEVSKTISATASGVGNPVYYIGNKTGRDGIHGATFASDELSEDSTSRRPNVQVGDPFTEKLLLEATLELSEKKLLVGLQDMGAAGLSCSTSEMSARGNVGMDIDVALVPQRERGMTPYEIMLSESQERMLAVCTLEQAPGFEAVCAKWGIEAVAIGKVIAEERVIVRSNGKIVADIPAQTLVLGGDAPQYTREIAVPSDLAEKLDYDPLNDSYPPPEKCFDLLWNDPSLVSKLWVYRQFDHTVMGATVKSPGEADAAVIWVPGTRKGLASKTDSNPYWVTLDPFWGAAHAVAEGALNVACVGAEPVAITNCLNFGNPYKPEAYYYFKEACAGMGEACKQFNTPVSGGNVSFYNESAEVAVMPTPTIGMLGILDEVTHNVGAGAIDGSILCLVGDTGAIELGGSALVRAVHGKNAGKIPELNFQRHRSLLKFLCEYIASQKILAAHDCSDGGLAFCLAEMATIGDCGLTATSPNDRNHLSWFSESASRAAICVSKRDIETLRESAENLNLSFHILGSCGGNRLTLGSWLDLPVADLRKRYYHRLFQAMGEEVA